MRPGGGYAGQRVADGKRGVAMYFGINSEHGKRVDDEVAFDYALDRCLNGSDQDKKEFREMLVEWYFSGDWIRRDGSADQREIDEDPDGDQSSEELVQYLREIQV